jgi:uncharacterized protein YbjQ (UPF0145 family)
MIMDTFFYDVIDIYLLGVPLALILGGFLRHLHHLRRKRMEELENQIKELEGQVVIVTGSSVAGKIITKVIGPVVGFSTMSSDNVGIFQQAEREAMLCLIKKAMEEGANAVIDLKMKTSRQQPETERMNPRVTYMGTAVVM